MIKHLPRSGSVSGQRFQFVDASMVSQLTKLQCCLTSDLLACILLAASLMSFNCLLCGHHFGVCKYSSTLVFGPVAHSEGSWQVLQDLLVRYRLSGSSNDCLSEEKTGPSLKSHDPVRALLIISVNPKCSNLVRHLSQH